MTSLLIFLFGLCIGSFLNVVILRIPEGKSIRGRSQCVACETSLAWFELVPLVSYIVLRGKCRSCHADISLQYPLVELATAFLFLLTWYRYGNDWKLVIGNWIFVSVLTVLFVQDFRFQILPDVITLPAIIVAIGFWFFDPYNLSSITYHLLATAIGGGFFLLQWLVSRGRWVGGGDIRLGALMGAILGWPNILLALFLAYVGGAIVGGTLLVLRQVTRKSQMAFGTFLTVSTVFTMFFGDQIVSWYAKVIGL